MGILWAWCWFVSSQKLNLIYFAHKFNLLLSKKLNFSPTKWCYEVYSGGIDRIRVVKDASDNGV